MTSPASRSPPPGSDGPPSERHRRDGPWVWIVGLSISAVLHLAFLFLYPVLMARVTPEPDGVSQADRPVRPFGMEVLRLSEAPDPPEDPLEAPEEPLEEPEPEPEPERAPPTAEPGPVEPAEEAAGEAPTAAEVLRAPESGDARIWRPVDSAVAGLSDEQRARLRILWRLEALNDSTLTEEERARRAREWVYTDEEGKTWGVSPGRLHLGDVTVPLPFDFSAPASARDELQAWRWRDAEEGAQASLVRDIWKERVEAIRERRDEERSDTSDVPR